LPNTVQVSDDDLPNAVQVLRRKPVVTGQGDRFQPEFADRPVALDVHMSRFVTVKAVKEKPIRTMDSRNRRQNTTPSDCAGMVSEGNHTLSFLPVGAGCLF